MSGKNILTAAISILILFTGNLSSQDIDPVSVQKMSKIKLLKTKDFKHTDVGKPSIEGSVTFIKGGFDVTAGGADVWGVKDEFSFVYIEKAGDFDIAARVESLTAPHLYTKAGLMVREDLTPGSRHIYFQLFPDNRQRNKNNGGFEYQYRQQTGGEMKAIYPARFEGTPDFPVTFPDTWIRLKRSGNKFTGYTGTDGKSWKEYASFTLDLPEKVYLGPAVTSHNTTESATAKFRNTGEYPKVLRRYGMKALRQSSGELAELSWQAVRTLAENCQGLTGLPFPSADRTLRTIDYIYDIF